MGNILSLGKVVFPGHPSSDAKEELEARGFTVTKTFAEIETNAPGPVAAVYHGNMEDFAQVAHMWQKLKTRRLIGMEYPGYGWRGAETATQEKVLDEVCGQASMLRRHGPAFVIGRSLGTFAAIHMALELGHENCAGLILLSPMLTAVATKIPPPLHRPFAFMDMIDNESAARRLDARIPVLIVHGQADHIVPVSNGRALRSLLTLCDYLELENIGHNDLCLSKLAWHRIESFMSINKGSALKPKGSAL